MQAEFYFDNLKRVKRIIYRDYINNDTSVRLFYYQGSNQNPYKDSINYVEGNTTYFTYNTGKLVYDSSNYWLSSTIDIITLKNYNYASNKVFINIEQRFPNQPSFNNFFRDTITLDGSGNILSNKYYILGQPNPEYISNYTYNNNNSPYKMLNVKQIEDICFLNDEYAPISNNFTSINISYPLSSSNSNYIWTSIYNAKNYPIKSTEVELNTNDKATRTFTYIAL